MWEKMSLQGAHGLHEKDLRVIVWSQSLKGRERKKNRESNEEAHFHRGHSTVSFRLSNVQKFQERSIISFPLFQELFTADELYQVRYRYSVPGSTLVGAERLERPNAVSLVFTFGVN